MSLDMINPSTRLMEAEAASPILMVPPFLGPGEESFMVLRMANHYHTFTVLPAIWELFLCLCGNCVTTQKKGVQLF